MVLARTSFALLLVASLAHGLYEGMYCGKESCYDVLNVTRESTKGQVSKAYRKLAREWHPDKHRDPEAKERATEQFRKIASAYEIISNEETRSEYDYMLDNPEEFYYNYYRYYKRQVSPKVDVRIVIVVTLTLVSLVHYYGMWSNYDTALRYLLTQHKYRSQAKDIAIREGLLGTDKRKNRLKTKDQIKEEEDAVLRKVMEEKMDIKGGYRRPDYMDFLLVRLIMLPYTVGKLIHWNLWWIWKFTIRKEEYGDEEKLYLIRRNMKLSETQWDMHEDFQKEEFLRRGLWQDKEFKVWKQQKEDEMKAKLAESGRAKMMRRYLKNNKNQISFGPE